MSQRGGSPSPPPSEPYRALFPLGALFAFLGAGVWPLTLWAGLAYPGSLHASLMIQGFELAFVSGFLLTVAPRMTRTDLADRREVPWVALTLVGFGVAAWSGHQTTAQTFSLATLLLLALALARRFFRRQNDPPEEFVFAPVGLFLGIAGTIIQLAASAGWIVEPSYRLGLRLLSLGMMLSLVLGLGALLIPVFLEMKNPLVIPKIAGPHERPGRRALYGALALSLALTFVADAVRVFPLAAWGRALIATLQLGLVWKIWRLPGRRTVPAFVLWSSGWLIGLGLWGAALEPRYAVGAMHVTLLGGFGALTMGIASRVTVTHGGHGPAAEVRLLTPDRAGLLGLALVTRLLGEFDRPRAPWWFAASALAWMAAWLGWLLASRRYLSPRAAASSATPGQQGAQTPN